VGGDPFQRPPPRRPEALEAGELELRRDARRPGPVDELARARDDRRGRRLGGRVSCSRPLRCGSRIGVDAEANLASALGDERREPVGEGGAFC
jgi:hypothetical protein